MHWHLKVHNLCMSRRALGRTIKIWCNVLHTPQNTLEHAVRGEGNAVRREGSRCCVHYIAESFLYHPRQLQGDSHMTIRWNLSHQVKIYLFTLGVLHTFFFGVQKPLYIIIECRNGHCHRNSLHDVTSISRRCSGLNRLCLSFCLSFQLVKWDRSRNSKTPLVRTYQINYPPWNPP